MPHMFYAQLHARLLLATANVRIAESHGRLDRTPANVHPIDRGSSRGVLLADLKPILNKEDLAS